VDTHALYRVPRALASHGIFAETGDCPFALTPQAELLREDIPGSLRAWTKMLGEESFWKPWGELFACVQTGKTACNRVFGMGRWEYVAAQPAAATFNRMAASNTEGRATPIVEAYDFAAATTIIDLGGGRGGLLAAILAKHSHVKGVLTDLPAVAAETTAFIAAQGLGARCAVVRNDLLASVPQGGDIYVMQSVLHGLHDAQAVAVAPKLPCCHTGVRHPPGHRGRLAAARRTVTPHQHARCPPDGHDRESGTEPGSSQDIFGSRGLHPASCYTDGDTRHLTGCEF
jgi:hypothetical protein